MVDTHWAHGLLMLLSSSHRSGGSWFRHSTYKVTLTFSRPLLKPTCPRLFPAVQSGYVAGRFADAVVLVAKNTLPCWRPVICQIGSNLLVSEFFWGPFRNQHLPWPFLVILMLTTL